MARAAIQTAHEKRRYGGVFLGFGELDTVMNGLAGSYGSSAEDLPRPSLELPNSCARAGPSQRLQTH